MLLSVSRRATRFSTLTAHPSSLSNIWYSAQHNSAGSQARGCSLAQRRAASHSVASKPRRRPARAAVLAASTFVVASGSTLPVSSAVGAMSDADLAQVAARMADPATGVPRQPCPSGPGGQTVQAFSDADAARWMLSNLANDGCGVSSPQDAAALGQRLVDARLVSLASPTRPATPQAAAFNPSDPQARHMFVSEAPAPPKGQALNAHYWWSPGAASSSSSPASSSPAAASARPAAAVAEELRRLILGLYGKYLSEDGRSVSYKAMGADPLFRRYVDAAAELQAVDLAPLSREELMCMFINLYNALIIHAHVAFGAPASALDRLAFFTRVAKYNIGGRDYSADDLENGVLRGNRPPASDVFALLGLTWLAKLPFGGSGSGDPRRAKVVDPVDPRIHFALVCGAKSCPPIQLYTPARLEAGLQAAAEVFCANEVQVDEARNEVTLSMILKWYGVDFGRTVPARLRYISQFLPDERRAALRRMLDGPGGGSSIKVSYSPYDWGVNSKE